MQNKNLLFPAERALSGLRDSGIRNTASAVSEIIDNSVDANAKNISVLILEKNQKSGKRFLDKIDEICILDDGNGMTEDILSKCLAVGGRDESDDNSENHTGRFGYGLPNSSMSQCKKVEVYSWQKKGKVYFTYLDFDEVLENKEQYCKPVEERKLPKKIEDCLKDKIKDSGTIIIWSKCDRLDIARGDTLFNHMKGDLCRTFRHRLDNDESYGKKVNITYQIASKDFNETFKANDPIYILVPNTVPGYEKEPTNEIVYDENIPIKYLNVEGELKETIVNMIFTVAKPSIQAIGGASPLGKHYAKNVGISVIRNAREINCKTYGFFDEFEQRNRWWGCEIRYGDMPIEDLKQVDAIFGLTNNKQDVTKFYYEDTKKGEEIFGEEYYEERKKTDLSLQMRIAISKAFKNVHSEQYGIIIKRGAGKKAGKSGNTSVDLVNKVLGDDKSKTRSLIEGKDKSEEQKKKEYKELIKTSDPDMSEEEQEKEAKEGIKRKVDIQFGDWPGEQFFTVRLAGTTAICVINREHPYYRDFYDKLSKNEDGNDIKTVDMLLMAFVRMEDEMYSMREDIEKIRLKWGRFLMDFMEELKKKN